MFMQKESNVVVVDDHPIMAQALAELLGSQPNIKVVKTLSSGRGLLDFFEKGRADLILLDLRLGDADGIELIKTIRARDQEIKILVFSMSEETEYAHRVISAGARGYIMKDQAAEALIEAVHEVLDGKIYLSKRVRDMKASDADKRESRSLSDREFSIFGMLGRGLSTRQIATELFLSQKTVEKHRENIKGKLGITNTPKLICEAARWVCVTDGTMVRKSGI